MQQFEQKEKITKKEKYGFANFLTMWEILHLTSSAFLNFA